MSNPNMNPDEVGNALSELFPLKARKKIYAAFTLVGFLMFLVASGFTLAGVEVPVWVVVVVGLFNLVNSFVTLIARANAGKAGLT